MLLPGQDFQRSKKTPTILGTPTSSIKTQLIHHSIDNSRCMTKSSITPQDLTAYPGVYITLTRNGTIRVKAHICFAPGPDAMLPIWRLFGRRCATLLPRTTKLPQRIGVAFP
jgi:hypothetical protein